MHLWEGVKERLKSTDLDRNLLESVIKLIDQQYQLELKVDPPFGICFCEKGDLLSQWKEYGDSTRGVSLGFDINWFDKNEINHQMPHSSSILYNAIGYDKVIYYSDQFEEEMAKQCYEAIKKDGVNAWINLIRPTFKHYSGFVKNVTFNEEREIRIVYYPVEEVKITGKNTDVSELKKEVKDHYEIPWVNGASHALKSVCIGHNCILDETDIKNLLIENNIELRKIKIINSECSYRIRESK